MKIIASLGDVCRPEEWLVTYHPYMEVQTYPPQLDEVQIKGKNLLALAVNKQENPGVITIQEAEYLGLPYKVYMGFALLEESADEAWLGIAEKILAALEEVEFESCQIPEGMNAYYLLEFDIGESCTSRTATQ